MDVPAVADGLPALGLGTYKNTGEQATESVRTALEMGYRHIDTAAYYNNEAAVGARIAVSSVPREDVVVATKLWYDALGRDDVVPAAEASLDRLGLDAVDILYVHWPAGSYDAESTASR
jgi:2,5-diketo-D-gluconate reductase B